MTLEPYVDLKFSDSAALNLLDGDVSRPCNGVLAALGWGVSANVGASLELHLPGALSKFDENFAHWGPKTVWKMNHGKPSPLYSKCLD